MLNHMALITEHDQNPGGVTLADLLRHLLPKGDNVRARAGLGRWAPTPAVTGAYEQRWARKCHPHGIRAHAP